MRNQLPLTCCGAQHQQLGIKIERIVGAWQTAAGCYQHSAAVPHIHDLASTAVKIRTFSRYIFRTEKGCVSLLKFKFSQILLGDKNATYLCSKIISTLLALKQQHILVRSISKLTYSLSVQQSPLSINILFIVTRSTVHDSNFLNLTLCIPLLPKSKDTHNMRTPCNTLPVLLA